MPAQLAELETCTVNDPQADHPGLDYPSSDAAETTCRLAEDLLRRALAETSREEAAQMSRIGRMIEHPAAKDLSLAMTDRMHRCDDASRTGRMWRGLVERFGSWAIEGFGPLDGLLMRLGSFGSRFLPGLVIGAIRKRLRATRAETSFSMPTKPSLTPSSPRAAVEAKARASTSINSARRCLANKKPGKAAARLCCNLLERDDIDYVSVKISAIFSQINLCAWRTNPGGDQRSPATALSRRPCRKRQVRQSRYGGISAICN